MINHKNSKYILQKTNRKEEIQMGKSIKETMQEFTVNQALNYLEGNPEENIPKLMAFVDRLMPKDWYTSQRNAIRRSIEEKNNWYPAYLKAL